MNSIRNIAALMLTGLLLQGCDSSYHPYNGDSGFKFTPLATDQFEIIYVGNPESKQSDVEQQWHHTARELCRGGSYHSEMMQGGVESTHLIWGGELIPKEDQRYRVAGQIRCLAPNIADKQHGTAQRLTGINLPTDQFVSGRTSD
ncbi:hypothetical protein [uncultured Neptuniibacter sp.]|uniref:hypothetical protein n=1 Tax=uncultured Neptuniibacter sp. TaxID=502143 RepID=UPI00261D6C9E|nr:hypothetical protein [uncultured Neptuniibacter sp.]